MAKKLTYIGSIKDGKLFLSEPRRKQMIADCAKIKEGKLVEIEIKTLPRRSDQQSKYYWAVIVALIQERLQDLGHEVDSDLTHDFLKSKFNSKKIVTEEGEVIGEIGGSTTRLSVSEFMDYISDIQRWAATYLDLVIPEPNSQSQMDF